MSAVDRVALALSDPTRLQILDMLAGGRAFDCCSPDNPDSPTAICACDILPKLEIAPSRLSYHMKELREAGLVAEQKQGRWIYYSLNRERVAQFTQELTARFLHTQPVSCCGPDRPAYTLVQLTEE